MKVSEEILSVHSDLLNDDDLREKRKKERYGMFIAVICQFFWALNALQLKSYKTLFPNQYKINNLIFWRSIPIGIIGYLSCKKKNIVIIKPNEIQNKMWFYTRAVGNYVCVMSWVLFLLYFRMSTCQCVNCCSPVLLIYLSIIILHENFYMRYLYGILLCIAGTWIILLNEKKATDSSTDIDNSFGHLFMGSLTGLAYLIIVSLNVFSMKIVAKEKIGGDVQNFYLGIYNSILAFIGVIILEHNFGLSNILYVLYAASNGVVFYLGNYLQSVALENMSMVKFTPSYYLRIIFTYILGLITFNEKVYFSDIIGSLLIISFQIYNSMYPVGKQVKEVTTDNNNENNNNIDLNYHRNDS